MYKLVVAADSHNDVAKLLRIIPIINAADYFIFCGDGMADVMRVRGRITVPIVCVKGNNDIGFNIVDTARVSFGSGHALVTHGHMFNVRKGVAGIYEFAKRSDSSLVFFGHTHMPFDKVIDGVHLINPGALCNGSYALVAGEGSLFVCKHNYIRG